ncbi:MAG: hypothetical protein HOP19_07140 [Acidobacteria bacterium]|nr:hypothetical protein [Acidobacteriota bacterium]
MSQFSIEQIVSAIRELTPDEYASLRKTLDDLDDAARKEREAAARERGRLASLRDFSADNQWLVDNRTEYAGQWVALRYGELISHSPNAKEVFAAARNSGYTDAVVMLVEAPPEPGHAVINLG